MPENTKLMIERLRQETREAAAGMNGRERSVLLREIVRAVYDAVKFNNPEGGGLDGRDGPERDGIGRVVEATEDHYNTTLQLSKWGSPNN